MMERRKTNLLLRLHKIRIAALASALETKTHRPRRSQ
jgi:hypothetical protein